MATLQHRLGSLFFMYAYQILHDFVFEGELTRTPFCCFL